MTILGHKSGSQNFLLGEMVGHIDYMGAWDQALPLFHWDHLASLPHPGATPAAKRPKLGYFGGQPISVVAGGCGLGGPLRLCGQDTNYPTNNQWLGLKAQAESDGSIKKIFFVPLRGNSFLHPTCIKHVNYLLLFNVI